MLGCALVAARPSAAQPSPRALQVRSGVTVTPDTVTVGGPFVVRVRVAAPAGAAVTFPAAPDSGGAVDLLDPRREERAAAPDGAVDVTAVYRMVAWDVGARPLGLGDVVVRAGGAERRVPLAGAAVFVRSVLPADSARRVPKPVREPVPDAGAWWLRLALLAAAVLGVVLGLVWLARRWWRSRRARPPADGAYREAIAAFDRLDRLGLVAAGEGGRHLALAADVVRDYLAARVPGAARALTTGELLPQLAADPELPAGRLAALFGVADLVKFARAPVAGAAAEEGGREARAVVTAAEDALRARAAREAAEAAARARAERDARRRYEEAQRRAAKRPGGRRDGAGPDEPATRERAA